MKYIKYFESANDFEIGDYVKLNKLKYIYQIYDKTKSPNGNEYYNLENTETLNSVVASDDNLTLIAKNKKELNIYLNSNKYNI